MDNKRIIWKNRLKSLLGSFMSNFKSVFRKRKENMGKTWAVEEQPNVQLWEPVYEQIKKQLDEQLNEQFWKQFYGQLWEQLEQLQTSILEEEDKE